MLQITNNLKYGRNPNHKKEQACSFIEMERRKAAEKISVWVTYNKYDNWTSFTDIFMYHPKAKYNFENKRCLSFLANPKCK